MKEYLISSCGDTVCVTKSPSETEALGAALGEKIKESVPCGGARFVALSGGLGAGKTAFVRGLSSALSPGSAVRSPTYTIVNEYRRGDLPLFHFDLCRISDEDDLYSTGYYEYLDSGICAVEWSNLARYALPKERWDVEIESLGDTERRITIKYISGGDNKC